MKQFTVTVSDEEEIALRTVMANIQEWVQNAISNRARQAIDQIIITTTDKNPKKLSTTEKLDIVKKTRIP